VRRKSFIIGVQCLPFRRVLDARACGDCVGAHASSYGRYLMANCERLRESRRDRERRVRVHRRDESGSKPGSSKCSFVAESQDVTAGPCAS
jgi:hypothetical protein